MPRERDPLLVEAHRISYRLRSTFFYRKLKEYNTLALPFRLASLFPLKDLYSWDDRAGWGIGEDAFAYIDQHPDISLIQVFCHPKLLKDFPMLLPYYRNVAAISQKGVSYLVGVNVGPLEEDTQHNYPLTDSQALTLARIFNEHASLIIDSSIQSFTREELHGLLLTSTGAQIQGSWNNAIGEEAEKVVQRLLISEAKERNLLSAFILREGTGVEIYEQEKLEDQLGHIDRYRGIMLNNRTSMHFSSEPDISLVGQQGITQGVIEVKGGTDPAGALERYGAAKKSFEDTRRSAPSAQTILVASCITREVRDRIHQDSTISWYFNLTEILSETAEDSKNQFMDVVFSLMEGTNNR